MPESTARKIDFQRREMPKQEPLVRSHNFSEVALGYTPELAMAEARRCLQCKNPFCVTGCPVQINIPAFIAAVAQGDFARESALTSNGICCPRMRASLPAGGAV
jgi:glutamate synthase (NADPH/NADH) small chain